jgi:hypothetical protein
MYLECGMIYLRSGIDLRAWARQKKENFLKIRM